MVSSPYSDVVAPTANHDDSLEEASALNKIMDPGPREGPCREAPSTGVGWVVGVESGSGVGVGVWDGVEDRGVVG